MDDLPDYELHRTSGESPAPAPVSERPVGLWAAIALLLVAAGAAAYFAFGWRSRSTPAPRASTAKTRLTEPQPALGARDEAIAVPPLDASDTLVRTLVQALSESPAVMAWLPTNGLIRNFTLVVANVADGVTPAKHLKVLRPSSTFRIVERNGATYVDQRSYDRYAPIAAAIASVDPAGAAKLYGTLKPRIEEAYRDLGFSNQSFDRALERAIAALLETPIVDDPPRLRPKGIGYAYADDRLEDLTAAQKQLLRMGPGNVRVIKAKLRDIALALGIPPTHLPAR
jgi:hypothetical protein